MRILSDRLWTGVKKGGETVRTLIRQTTVITSHTEPEILEDADVVIDGKLYL